ncbi:hypothetical protein [Bacteroides faecalis]|uniref:Uncharacterized protein n=1 Tax=Bacteroides faecalis TaxID=2447885 RepID=A0A401LSQ2_9BACE|nr:hypothetical protein [Bacteroides faecalis]GCB34519.1 hypothetical protein KGMB02408_14640 [Bacteroides faecalis]
MADYLKQKELYIKQYPQAKNWLNQCVICQEIGYKPEMPENIYPGVLAQNIRKLFKPLPVNEHGICAQCAAYIHNI